MDDNNIFSDVNGYDDYLNNYMELWDLSFKTIMILATMYGVRITNISKDMSTITLYIVVPSLSEFEDKYGNEMSGEYLAKVFTSTLINTEKEINGVVTYIVKYKETEDIHTKETGYHLASTFVNRILSKGENDNGRF